MKHKFVEVCELFFNNNYKPQSKLTLEETFYDKIIPYFSNYYVEDITIELIEKWKLVINSKNYSNNYKRRLYYSFVSFYDYLVKKCIVASNLVREVGNFNLDNIKIRHNVYTYKDFKRFIRYIDNYVYKVFFEFMYFTGCRPGEVMALKFSDINKNIVSINKTISEHSVNGVRVINSPKTISSNREILIDRKLENKIKKLMRYYGVIDSDIFVFGGNKPLAPTTINRYKKKACIKAGLKPIKLHEFRHSHATLLYNIGLDTKLIQKRLGHSDISTTMNTYVHIGNKQQKRVLRTLNLFRLIF